MLICPNRKRLLTPQEPIQGFRWPSFATSGGQRKDCHLRWRTVLRVHRSDRLEPNLIAEASAYCLRPFGEFPPRPLETVIAMAHCPGRQCGEQNIVFPIWSGDQ